MSDVADIGPHGRRRGSRPLLRTAVGQTLRRNRRKQSRTLADVAEQARVSVQYLSEVERGRKEVSSELLAAVCAALGIELPDLLVEVWRDLAESWRDLANDRATIIRLEPARQRRAVEPPARQRPAVDPPTRRPGDVVLLVA